ncbi:hypothetical protein ACWD6N_03370 [Micromonospora sp. NPDC005163]
MGEVPTTIRDATARRARVALREIATIEARLADEHVPRRPEWECRTCDAGTSWPCAPAQVRLAETYRRDRIGLSMHVGSLLYVALQERPSEDASDLYERIVGWIR